MPFTLFHTNHAILNFHKPDDLYHWYVYSTYHCFHLLAVQAFLLHQKDPPEDPSAKNLSSSMFLSQVWQYRYSSQASSAKCILSKCHASNFFIDLLTIFPSFICWSAFLDWVNFSPFLNYSIIPSEELYIYSYLFSFSCIQNDISIFYKNFTNQLVKTCTQYTIPFDSQTPIPTWL